MLWFDVGIKRYTTSDKIQEKRKSCGLMQESKDIQQKGFDAWEIQVVV